MKVVLCTIIVVITSNLIRKITLNILCSVPCCEVQHFFFWLSMGRRWAIRTLNLKEVSYESGNLHNHHCDNFEPNSKDNSEYVLICSLLRGSPDFFFLALHCNALSYHNFEIERSQYCKWYVPRTPNSSFYFPKASCNCWKRFSVYTFPRFLFNLRALQLWFLSLDSERLYFRISNGYVIRIRCKH